MTFRIDAVFDLASGEQPLSWGQEAVIQGYFSVDQGRVVVDDVTAEILSWSTSEIRFNPIKSDLVDGSYAVHVDCVDVPYYAVVNDLTSAAVNQTAAVDHDHDTIAAAALASASQVQSAAITQEANDVEYLHDFTSDSIDTWTFVRASVASAPDRTGTIRFYDSGEPAWYKNRGILLEGSATNLLPYSDPTQWTPNGADGSAVNWGEIDGQQSYLISGTTSSAGVRASSLGALSGDYTFSAMTAYGEVAPDIDVLMLGMTNSGFISSSERLITRGPGNFGASVDLMGVQNLVAGYPTGIEVRYTGLSEGDSNFTLYAGNTARVAYKDVVVSLPQLEQGPHSTSFIRTNGATVTRALATLDSPMGSLGALPAEGVTNDFAIQFEFMLGSDYADWGNYANQTYLFELWGDASNFVQLRRYSATQLRLFWTKGGTNYHQTLTLSDDTLGSLVDIRIKTSSTTGLKFWVNGVASGEDVNTDAFAVALDHVYLGNNNVGNRFASMVIGRFRIRTADLADATIEAWDSCYTEYLHDFRHRDLGGVTYTRPSIATIPYSGRYHDLAVDAPPWGKYGILLESARTNSCINDEADTTDWTPSGALLDYDKPEGDIRFVDLFEDDTNAQHRVYGTSSGVSGVDKHESYSSVIKKGTSRYLGMRYTSSGHGFWLVIDTANWTIYSSGTSGSGTFEFASIEPINAYMARVIGIGGRDPGLSGALLQFLSGMPDPDNPNTGIPSYQGNGGYLVGSYGEQQNDGTDDGAVGTGFASSVIKTAGAQVTRADSVCEGSFADHGIKPFKSNFTMSIRFRTSMIWNQMHSGIGLFTVRAGNDLFHIRTYGVNGLGARAYIGSVWQDAVFISHTDITDLPPGTMVTIVARSDATTGIQLWYQCDAVDSGNVLVSGTEAEVAPSTDFDLIQIGTQLILWEPLQYKVYGRSLSDQEVLDLIAQPYFDEYAHDFDAFDLGGFTYARASVANASDCYGRVDEMAVDDPCWDGGTGILLEPSATNMVPRSNDLTHTEWNRGGDATVSLHPTIPAPDGSMNAAHITGTSGGAGFLYLGGVANNNELDYGAIWARTVSGTGDAALITGNHGTAHIICSLTETWQRFSGPMRPDNTTFYPVDFRDAGTTVTEVLVWNPQCEANSVSISSDIITSGTTVTRADNLAAASFSALDGLPAAGVTNDFCLQVVFAIPVDYALLPDSKYFFALMTGTTTANGSINCFKPSTNRLTVSFGTDTGWKADVNFDGRSGETAGTLYDIRVRVSSVDGIQCWLNGTQAGNAGHLTGTATAYDNFAWASRQTTGSSDPMPIIAHRCRIYPYYCSNAEIEAWPTWVEPPAPPALPVLHFTEAADLTSAGTIQAGAIVQEYLHDFSANVLGDWTHARASAATALNTSNQLVSYTSGNPAYVKDQGIQIEATSTNLFPYSDMSDWSAINTGSVATQNQVDIFGNTYSAYLIEDNGTSSSAGWYKDMGSGLDNTKDRVFSVFVKKTAGHTHTLSMDLYNVGTQCVAQMDTNTGEIKDGYDVSSGSTYGVIDAGAWWRMWVHIPSGASTAVECTINTAYGTDINAPNGSSSATGTNIVCCAQIEYGTRPSSLIVSSGSTVTRADATCDATFSALGSGLPAGGLTDNISGQIVVYLDRTTQDYPTTKGFFAIIAEEGTYNDGLDLYNDGAAGFNYVRARYDDFGTDSVTNGTARGPLVDFRFRKSSVDGLDLWIDSTYIGNDPTIEAFHNPIYLAKLGVSNSGTSAYGLNVKKVRIIPSALTDAEIEAWDNEYLHDFTTNSIGDWTFDRASDAIAPNVSGVLQTYTPGQPAYYKNQGLLLEDTSTNLQDFSADHSAWTTSGTGGAPTIAVGDSDLGITAWQHTKAAVADSGIYSTFPDAGTADRSATIWCKPVTKNSDGSCFSIRFRDLGTGSDSYQPTSVTIDGNGTSTWELNTGDWCLTVGGLDTGVWTKVTLFFDNIAVAADIRTYLYAGSRNTAETASCHLAGPQWERGIATSYMPVTDSGSTTRAVTNCTATFSELGSPLPAGGVLNNLSFQFVLRLGVDLAGLPDKHLFKIYASANGSADSIESFVNADATSIAVRQKRNSGSLTSNFSVGALKAGDLIDIRGSKRSVGAASFYINGTKMQSTQELDWSAPLDSVALGRNYTLAAWANVLFAKVRIRPEALTDEEIESWT